MSSLITARDNNMFVQDASEASVLRLDEHYCLFVVLKRENAKHGSTILKHLRTSENEGHENNVESIDAS